MTPGSSSTAWTNASTPPLNSVNQCFYPSEAAHPRPNFPTPFTKKRLVKVASSCAICWHGCASSGASRRDALRPNLARCGLRGVARGSPGAGRRGTWEGEAPQRLEKSWDPWERILFDLGWFGVISCNLIILILTQHPVEGLWFVFWSAKLNQWFVWMVFDIRTGGAPHLTM